MKRTIILICQLMIMGYALIYAENSIEVDGKRDRFDVNCALKTDFDRAEFKRQLDNNTEEMLQKRACYIACRLQKWGLFNGTDINVERLDDIITRRHKNCNFKDLILAEVHECAANVQGITDECELAMTFHNCAFPLLRRCKHGRTR